MKLKGFFRPFSIQPDFFKRRFHPFSLSFLWPQASRRPWSLPSLKRSSVPVTLIEGLTYDVMNISELLITASGTATLEGAILGTPMVIIYRVSRLSYWIGRALIRVDHIGLVNLVAGKRIVPELIQKDANPRRIAEEALRILRDPVLQSADEGLDGRGPAAPRGTRSNRSGCPDRLFGPRFSFRHFSSMVLAIYIDFHLYS